jgi:hypothetical protein
MSARLMKKAQGKGQFKIVLEKTPLPDGAVGNDPSGRVL